MRDVLYIAGLFLLTLVLALDFPSGITVVPPPEPEKKAFASFLILSPRVHAACLEAAKTSWQVRTGSRSRRPIGSLDSDVPLLADSFYAPPETSFGRLRVSAFPVGEPDTDGYSLLPATGGRDVAGFTVKPRPDAAPDGPPAAFSREEMVSLDDFTKIKEIMK